MKFIKKLNKRSQKTILSILVILFLAIILKSLLPNTYEFYGPFQFNIVFKGEIPVDVLLFTFKYSDSNGVSSANISPTESNGVYTIQFDDIPLPQDDYFMTVSSSDTATKSLLTTRKLVIQNKTTISDPDGIKVTLTKSDNTIIIEGAP
jgi:Tfp pilus assembly protein PilZ